MNWTKDLPAEGKMKELGVEWNINKEGVPIAEINWELSEEQQARIGKKKNDDWVMEMALASENGAEFPMPILQKEKGQYIIHGGVHRCYMAKLRGELTIPCYQVKITDIRTLDIFPRAINTVHGHRESREAELTHAKYLAEKHGWNAEQLSKWMNIPISQISVALRVGKVEDKLKEIGIKTDHLSKTILVSLSPLTGNNNVLKNVVKLLKDNDLAGDRAKQVIDDAKKCQTEKQCLAEIERWRTILEVRKPKTNSKGELPAKRKNRGTFIDLLTRMEKFLEGIKNPNQLQLDDQDSHIAAKSWDKIEQKMNTLMRGVEK